MSEATIWGSLQTPLPLMVALGYILVKQEVSLSLEHEDDPIVKTMHSIAKETLDHEVHDEEKMIKILLNVCKYNHDQYKWILQAMKRMVLTQSEYEYTQMMAIFTMKYVQEKYSQQPSTFSMLLKKSHIKKASMLNALHNYPYLVIIFSRNVRSYPDQMVILYM